MVDTSAGVKLHHNYGAMVIWGNCNFAPYYVIKELIVIQYPVTLISLLFLLEVHMLISSW